jgi:gas vesicle protein
MESGKTAVGVLLGIGVGALLGVLFAPHKGTKTRRKIMSKGQDYADELKGKFNGLYQEVSDKYEDILEDAKTMVSPK